MLGRITVHRLRGDRLDILMDDRTAECLGAISARWKLGVVPNLGPCLVACYDVRTGSMVLQRNAITNAEGRPHRIQFAGKRVAALDLPSDGTREARCCGLMMLGEVHVMFLDTT